jgi:hypothetical protein
MHQLGIISWACFSYQYFSRADVYNVSRIKEVCAPSFGKYKGKSAQILGSDSDLKHHVIHRAHCLPKDKSS